GILMNDVFVRIAQDFLHRLKIQPLARHFRRLRIFFENRKEALSLAFGLLNDAVLVGCRLFTDLCGLAAGAAKLLVRVLIGFLDEAILVLLGALHLVKRVGHFTRRRRILDRNGVDRQASRITIERILNDITYFRSDAAAVVAED